jgi:CRISPR system Cascade subunit CasC
MSNKNNTSSAVAKTVKNMYVEFHILQNVAPSNANSDQNGSHKDCMVGGYRRPRWSSQSSKRAVRDYDIEFPETWQTKSHSSRLLISNKILPAVMSIATTKLSDNEVAFAVGQIFSSLLAGKIDANEELDEGDVEDNDFRTKETLSLTDGEIDFVAKFIATHLDDLYPLAAARRKAPKKAKADATKEAVDDAPIKQAKKDALDKKITKLKRETKFVAEMHAACPPSLDIAMFGRMVASSTHLNVDSAFSVMHSVGVNRMTAETDFWTSKDTLQNSEDTGAANFGDTSFSSNTFYRYGAIDVLGLRENAIGDQKTATALAEAIATVGKAFVLSEPTGKSASFARFNPPDFVLVSLVINGIRCSLLNAFLLPVKPKDDRSLVGVAGDALLEYRKTMLRMYDIPVESLVCTSIDFEADAVKSVKVKDSLAEVLASLKDAIILSL